MNVVLVIAVFIAAFAGGFFGTLLARTERKIPVITHVKEAVQGETAEDRGRRIFEEWLYGPLRGGDS